MRKFILVWAAWLPALLSAAVPTPKEHFGFTPGDDYKLAGYTQISTYFQKLASGSDRIRIREFGRTSHGKPMYAAFISSPENLAKIFDLYFTTKERGTGIGLSMVFRIVQMHDGEVEVQSTPGRGTTFRVLLPRANDNA